MTGNPPHGGQDARSLLPQFRYQGVVLDYRGLRYCPHPDVIHPTVIETNSSWGRPLGRYYMYYAPHDAPGGISLAYADHPEGPWREHAHNPVIGRAWPPHFEVSHVSSPHVIWNPEQECLFLYFHGENDTTRYARSRDGIHFEYGGVAVDTGMFEAGTDVTEASYARVFRHSPPGATPRYIMLVMGNHAGTRKVYYAESPDGMAWEPRRKALLTPPPGTDQMGPGSLLEWNGRYYIVDYANLADSPLFDPCSNLYLHEVDARCEQVQYHGLIMHHTVPGPENRRVNDPCFLRTGDKLYLYINIGRRRNQRIALAVADL